MSTGNYLSNIKDLMQQYKVLSEKAIEQLPEEKLFFTPDENTNSIAIIIQHMAGNMQSRFTDFLTTDGEKTWRKRDEEFIPVIKDKATLMKTWEDGWTLVLNAIDSLDDSHLDKIIFIRNQAHTVTEALNRQLAHYAYHTGQIVFFAKMLKEDDWESLSIPKKKI